MTGEGRLDHALIVARFADPATARYVYDDLCEAGKRDGLHIDGVLIVDADEEGALHLQRMSDHSARTGIRWSVVGESMAAALLPSADVGEMAVAGPGLRGASASDGEIETNVAAVIGPGTSGVLCLAAADVVDEVEGTMPWAQEIRTFAIDATTAYAVTAAAAAKAEAVERRAIPRKP